MGQVVGVKVLESLFHVLKLYNLNPPITTLFSQAPRNERELPRITYYARKSILRKWVYSFKHSGNSRGQHRGPENMYVFWQSGLKMSEFFGLSWPGREFSKRGIPLVSIPRFGLALFCCHLNNFSGGFAVHCGKPHHSPRYA